MPLLSFVERMFVEALVSLSCSASWFGSSNCGPPCATLLFSPSSLSSSGLFPSVQIPLTGSKYLFVEDDGDDDNDSRGGGK